MPLSGKRILIIEDEYYIAADLKQALDEAGAEVIGPAGRLDKGLALAAGGIDAALLDLNLHGEPSFAIADKLDAKAVPYMFLTGYDSWVIPDRYAAIRKLTKPCDMNQVVANVVQMVAGG